MRPSDHMQDYLDQICGQVRWKKAHPVIRKELQDHLQDQAQAFEDEGNTPEKAAEMAVREMGDPVMLGTQFDRCYRPGFNWPILLTTLILIALGLIARMMMYSYTGNWFSVGDIVISLLISAGIVLTVLKIDYTILSKTWLIYGLYVAGMLLFGLLSFSHGRWMLLLSYYKITAVPIVSASLIYRFRDGNYLRVMMCFALVLFPLMAAYGLFAPVLWGMLTALVIFAAALFTGVFENIRHRILTLLLLIFPFPAAVGWVLLTVPDHRLADRFATLFPRTDPQGYGYVGMLIRNALSQAKWIGPMDNFSELLLPTSGVDHLLTWLICRFGWISLAIVLALIGLIAAFGIRVYRRQTGLLSRLLLIGIYAAWGAQASSSLLVGLGVIYTFSYPFPFFGGNMALIFNAVLLGFLLSVCQMGTLGSAMENRPFEKVELLRMYQFDGTMIRLEISKNRILLEHKQKPNNDVAMKLKERRENQQFNR